MSLLTMRELQRPAAHARQRAGLFMGLDGTLVEPMAGHLDPQQLRLRPGAVAALARLQSAGLALVIVTNQPGLARGRITRAEFARLQQGLLQRLQDEAGVAIDGVEVCPHGPDAQGRPACLCRKPAPGMLIRAAHRHGLDLARCWMVGSTLDDVEAGHRAGGAGLLLDTGCETVWRRSPLREPDARFFDWAAVADHVEQQAGRRTRAEPTDWLPLPLPGYGSRPPGAALPP